MVYEQQEEAFFERKGVSTFSKIYRGTADENIAA
jgi:hypothetical protein